MNPSNYEQPGLSLPEPMAAGESTVGTTENLPVTSPEASQGLAPPPPVASGSAAVAPFFDPALPLTPVQPGGPTTTAATPGLADDADLIEKEWVTKAKAIVERTKDDPHQQTQEMNYFKADYLKKRYNKDIKISES